LDIFEYLMVVVSIVLGLGVTQTLRGFSKIAQSSRTFLPLTMWTAVLFYLYLQVWWALWDLHAVDVWNQFYFYLLVAIPCSLFAATELLLPLASNAKTDWQSHFFSVQKWFFGVFFAFSVIAILESYVLLDVSFTHPYRLVQVALSAIVAAGFFANNTKTHVWLSAIYLFGLLIGQVLFRFLPGLS
jgi:hypothetical protein